ncbi:hypothetical protein JOF56_004859 [Kibdelosporangium banguiense]|uniref:DUF4352 domain-containing protein n=1 Tax=Kibdelosporangium banguiense TaxID=1365924 RepID=A0ABS4TKG5_9PSEU|nr:DUF4352 domain-containing protein [Kibdelosporangium banguiense]MBP2324474.1 hypothetical protein [Kibdelosporangium banguiense]
MRPALIVAAILMLAGCSPSDPAPTPTTTSSRPTYELSPRTARPDETPLKLPAKQDGETEFVLVGITPKLPSLTGSHIDFDAKGVFYRIRVAATNTGRTNVDFDTRKQLLVTQDGATHVPDDPAMTVKRQPDQFVLGANVRLEFDLYYDIPKDAQPKALKVFGGKTLTDQDDATGTDIPLT